MSQVRKLHLQARLLHVVLPSSPDRFCPLPCCVPEDVGAGRHSRPSGSTARRPRFFATPAAYNAPQGSYRRGNIGLVDERTKAVIGILGILTALFGAVILVFVLDHFRFLAARVPFDAAHWRSGSSSD